MASTARRIAPSLVDGDDDYGLDRCDEDDSVEGVAMGDALDDDAGKAQRPPTVAELIAWRSEERGADAKGSAESKPAADSANEPQADILARAGVPRDVLAVTIQPDPVHPGMAKEVPYAQGEATDRRRLAAALVGVGGVLHRLLDGTAMGELDVETARGLAFALAADAGTVEAEIMAQFAAGAVVLQSRMMAAAARSTRDRSAGSAKAAREYMRASATGFRLVERTLQAVDLARGRRRDRTSVPVFVVGRLPGGTQGNGENG